MRRRPGSAGQSVINGAVKAALIAGVSVGVLAVPVGTAHADPLPPQGPAPDQWHCRTVSGNDVLCLRLNQFLGWWTGFNTEYHAGSTGIPPIYIKLMWSSKGGSGTFPASGEFTLYPGQVGRGDSWADLPPFACVGVRAQIRKGHVWGTWLTEPVTVCRDN